MRERMLRKIVYLPRKMLQRFKLLAEEDGRDFNELMRVALGMYIEPRYEKLTKRKGK